MASSIEEMLKQLLQGGSPNSGAVALEDPEYQLDITNLQSQQSEAEAEALAQQTDTASRYERLRRAAERQLPKDITGVQESAAGRGMYYAGGRVEAEGNLNKNHADYVAQTAESQTSELNNILRGLTTRRNETQRGLSLAQQNAAQRALERARNAAPPAPVTPGPAVTQPAVTQPQPQPQSPIQRAVANNPAVRPVAKAPVKTAAQLAQEKAWAAYVKYNPENARRVVLAARAKAGGR